MDMNTLMSRISSLNQEYVTEEDAPDAPPLGNETVTREVQVAEPWFPIDIYRHKRNKRMNDAKREYPIGSRSFIKSIVETVLNGGSGSEGLAIARKRLDADIASLEKSGYKDRVEIAKNQYMEEKFLPAVEIVVNSSSPDELLNCKSALEAFDKMAIGEGSMKGYTAAYIRQAYKDSLGNRRGDSDPTVEGEMRRIRTLVSNDQIRTAIGLATKIKEQIDNGEHQASPEDYAVIGRIVAYAN